MYVYAPTKRYECPVCGQQKPTTRLVTPKGFSLLELLCAVAIIGLCMAIAIPYMMGAVAKAHAIAAPYEANRR
jgi:prepilin-type N-terminal cleavage/methylation domain-containing protein